jgi:hypothetical protein
MPISSKLFLAALTLFACSTIFLVAGTIVGKFAVEKLKQAAVASSEDYNYFGGDYLQRRTEESAETAKFLNSLDREKSKACDILEKEFDRKSERANRATRVNDYAFKALRDIWFIQQDVFRAHGRYFQGKETINPAPRIGHNGQVDFQETLTDQISDWKEFGYQDQFAPVSIRCHVYESPKGHGYKARCSFRMGGDLWIIEMHVGPEDHRDSDQLRWRIQPSPEIF